jgi:hypothetical protein
MVPEDLAMEIANRKSMPKDFFSISIEDDILYSLPHVLDGYTPSSSAMTLFLMELGSTINWADERPCFEAILGLLASLCAVVPDDDEDGPLSKRVQHEIMTVVLPEIRKEAFRPSVTLDDEGSVIRVELPDFDA